MTTEEESPSSNSSSSSVASAAAVPTPRSQFRLVAATLLGRNPTSFGERVIDKSYDRQIMQRAMTSNKTSSSMDDSTNEASASQEAAVASPPSIDENLKVLYINLIIADSSEAVKRTVKEKIAEKNLPPTIHKVASKVAPRVAKRVATPEFMANIMAEKLPQELPKKLEKRGITGVVAETVFMEAPYIVMQLQVQQVDVFRLVESRTRDFYDDETGELESRAAMTESAADYVMKFFDCFFRLIGKRRQAAIEDFYLPGIVQKKLVAFIPDLLAAKMERKGLEIDSEVLPEEKQSRFFYTQIQKMRATKKDSPNAPIVGFYRTKEKEKTE